MKSKQKFDKLKNYSIIWFINGMNGNAFIVEESIECVTKYLSEIIIPDELENQYRFYCSNLIDYIDLNADANCWLDVTDEDSLHGLSIDSSGCEIHTDYLVCHVINEIELIIEEEYQLLISSKA